ncbi:MAG: hypothetical protein GU347_03990 [Desulfurococcales archaeon]|nr:hypothetical protein [Desulfurococcales archaeon]
MMKVEVQAGSRIHLGFYNIISKARIYGSLGIYLEEPKTKVIVHDSGSFTEEASEVIGKICGEMYKLGAEVLSSPPRHVGFGSTTQISMSIALGATKLCKKKLDYRKLALLAGRGAISGIGIHAFRYGGLIIDGGRKFSDRLRNPANVSDLPPLISRLKFPEEWSIVLVVPKEGKRVKEEDEAFMFMPHHPSFDQAILYKAMMMVLHGVLSRDLDVFSQGVEEIQRKMGEYFESYQGGPYSSEKTLGAVNALTLAGARGVGQSSWGPLAYGFIVNERKSEVEEKLKIFLKREGVDGEVIFTKARNRGARLIHL